MVRWNKNEVEFLKINFATQTDAFLAKKLNRSLKSISYMAFKLKLRKTQTHLNSVNKNLNFAITKELLERLYLFEEKSFRTIANDLAIGKTTVEYYLRKYEIPRRSNLDISRKNNFKAQGWAKGLTKEDVRIENIAIGIRKAYELKRKNRIKVIEKKFGKGMRDLLIEFYVNKGLSMVKVAETIGLNRILISDLISFYSIEKRKNYSKISSLKGKYHSQFGKTWEEVRGKKKADEDKLKISRSSRKNIIRRIANNEMPFRDTKIELMMEKELSRRDIKFEKQFIVENKFVCDFAILEYKIIIECDGDYWHGNPNVYSKGELNEVQRKKIDIDKYKNKYLTNKGWKVLRFYETDILNHIGDCVDIIVEELKKIKSSLD